MSIFGQQLRQIRTQKGFRLNEFAKEIGVSAAYLSNLERGKTETIQLQVLNKLQREFHMFIDIEPSADNPFSGRLERLNRMLKNLSVENVEAAEYILQTAERATELFSKRRCTEGNHIL